MKHIVFISLLFISTNCISQGLPGEYIQIDSNGDQIIQTDEVQSVIDSFFMSDSAYSVEFIHGLIDFFFEQD